MMCFVVEYQVAIDTITWQVLKMWKYELDMMIGKSSKTLSTILAVCYSHLLIFETNVFLQQYKKAMLLF